MRMSPGSLPNQRKAPAQTSRPTIARTTPATTSMSPAEERGMVRNESARDSRRDGLRSLEAEVEQHERDPLQHVVHRVVVEVHRIESHVSLLQDCRTDGDGETDGDQPPADTSDPYKLVQRRDQHQK